MSEPSAAVPRLARRRPLSLPGSAPAEPYVDSWGCTWETTDDGITGSVTSIRSPTGMPWRASRHPIRTKPTAWPRSTGVPSRRRSPASGGREAFAVGSLEHGHAFLRLSYLRGYERLLYDMADGDPRLGRLIEMVETFSLGIVQRYVDLGVAMMRYPEDLGMQRGPDARAGAFPRVHQARLRALDGPGPRRGLPGAHALRRRHSRPGGRSRRQRRGCPEPPGPRQRHRLDRGPPEGTRLHRPRHRPPVRHPLRHAPRRSTP